MNKMNYTVTKSAATKVTVTISRRQMWENFISLWKDMAWEDFSGFGRIGTVKEISNVLLSGEGLTIIQADVRRLFRDGYTVSLMGDALKELEMPGDVLTEIVVQDVNDFTGDVEESIVISHENINY